MIIIIAISEKKNRMSLSVGGKVTKSESNADQKNNSENIADISLIVVVSKREKVSFLRGTVFE